MRRMWTLTALLTTSIIGMSVALLGGQQADPNTPAFEVASVKANVSNEPREFIRFQPFRATNVRLRMLLRFAYSLQNFEMDGGPGWIDTDHFDIAASTHGEPSEMQLRAMTAALLRDRFRLAVHREKRERPIYALVVARTDRALGPQLRESIADCTPSGPFAPRPKPDPNRPLCHVIPGPAGATAGHVTMQEWARGLSLIVGRTVVDHTELTGNYDLAMTFAPEATPASDSSPVPAVSDPGGPSLFTALQEQLGLKLESTRGPVDVLVIDHVERPTPD